MPHNIRRAKENSFRRFSLHERHQPPKPRSAMQSPATSLTPHRLDTVSFGKIVQIREVLLKAQAKGARVIRFESGDPSVSIAPHVLTAIADARAAGKTAY